MWKAASQIKSRIAQAKALWQVGTRWTQELREGQSGQDRSMAMKMERGQVPDHPRFLKVRSFIFIPRAMGNDSSVWMCVCDVCMCVCVHVQACVTDQISMLKRPQDRPEVSKHFL